MAVWFNRHRLDNSSSELVVKSIYAGNKLEFETAMRVAMTYPHARFYSNLPVPTESGVTHIDIVVVVGWFVVVAEMKYYRRSLSGNITDRHWLADTGFHKYRIVNPLQQNHHHIISLSSALVRKGYSLKMLKFRDYIVVPDGCLLNIPRELNRVILDVSSFDDLIGLLHSKSPDIPDDGLIKILDGWRDYSGM